MATPMSMSGLPALMDPDNALNVRETKKFETVIPTTDGLSVGPQQHTNHPSGAAAVEESVEANSDAGEGQNRPFQTPEDSQKQTGLKPPREKKSTTDHEPSSFRENLEKGIPIECGKRSVFGFGLSHDQEDALYQYITNKSSKRPPGYEPDREALADCWGSPEPEREDNSEEDIPVIFSADLSETLSTKNPTSIAEPGKEPSESGENSQPVNLPPGSEPDVEKEEDDSVDVESTESLYEGEGGVDLGARSAGALDATGNVGDGDEVQRREDDAEELADRLLIMQKVKECYGLGVKTSLERVMRKGDVKPTVTAKGPQHSITFGKGKSKQEVPSAVVREDNHVVSLRISEVAEDASFSNLWEDECMRYLERAPEFRARLHYEVRVILISPAFHVVGRTVTAFAHFYEKKFGRTVDSVGFSTTARLCRSMPHIVQRALLIDKGKLRLVNTPKNHRIVACIRSGLRRIVYDILKNHLGIDLEAIEALCDRVIGQPLNEVLIDHGYQTPSMECLLRDMPDIVYLDERTERTRVYLCNGAEDPALTDGLLIQRPSQEECFDGMSQDKSKFNRSGSICYSKLLEEEKLQSLDDDVVEQLIKSPEGPKSGPNGMAPEELSDLRVLCAAESSSPYTDASIYTVEDVSPHVRLRFRLLLALHDDGRGIKVEDLPIVYEKMFGGPLDLSTLGFDSLQELIDAWKDVILVKDSNDGWIFPINTLDNNRVLNTITSGLRSAVFAILLARYPKGLEPLELVECLEETLSGKLWEILKSNGYIFKNMSKTGEALLKGPSDFQLAECSELRLLLKDMEDFVRLGCREEGVLIVKLRDGEFPLLDLLDCEVSEEPTDGKDEQSCDSSDVDVIKAKLMTKNLLINTATEPSGDVIMARDVQLPASINSRGSKAEHEVIEGNIRNEGLIPLITKSSKMENLSSPSTSPFLVSDVIVYTPKQANYPSYKLIHETRMIFGSPKHMENGLTVEEFCTIYREHTGQPIHLDGFKSMESLLQAMPEIVSFELTSVSDEQMITLVQSRQNMRILSVTKAGLRQVLFWILLKNPGGIWKELLEGWYLDFAGWPLSSALASHGYDKPHRAPLEPVTQFLQDMADLLAVDDNDPNLYIWIGLYKDPILADASLLGLPMESIQYDPTNEENENSRWHTSVIAKAATHLRNKEFEKTIIARYQDHCEGCNEGKDSIFYEN